MVSYFVIQTKGQQSLGPFVTYAEACAHLAENRAQLRGARVVCVTNWG